MISRLKRMLLLDSRTYKAYGEFRELYERADDPEAFHRALQEGDVDRAADHVDMTPDELLDHFGELLEFGEGLADDYGDLTDGEKEEFINA